MCIIMGLVVVWAWEINLYTVVCGEGFSFNFRPENFLSRFTSIYRQLCCAVQSLTTTHSSGHWGIHH